MIDEQFLQSAVRIRRTYLKLSNNLELYHRQAKKLAEVLSENLDKIAKVEEDVKDKKSDNKQALEKMINIVADVEKQGNDLEKITDDMNKEIENLAKEEQELYRNIKQRHSNLTDEEIVESVKQRLISENIYYND